MPIGLTLPLAQTTSSLGYLAFSTTELEAATYNLRSLLLTNWGERPNHFYLGCNLVEFLFQNVSDEVEEKISSRITTQVAKWLPYIVIKDLQVQYTDSENRIQIRVDFHLKHRPDQFKSVTVEV